MSKALITLSVFEAFHADGVYLGDSLTLSVKDSGKRVAKGVQAKLYDFQSTPDGSSVKLEMDMSEATYLNASLDVNTGSTVSIRVRRADGSKLEGKRINATVGAVSFQE